MVVCPDAVDEDAAYLQSLGFASFIENERSSEAIRRGDVSIESMTSNTESTV
jgi:hypothetical protein